MTSGRPRPRSRAACLAAAALLSRIAAASPPAWSLLEAASPLLGPRAGAAFASAARAPARADGLAAASVVFGGVNSSAGVGDCAWAVAGAPSLPLPAGGLWAAVPTTAVTGSAAAGAADAAHPPPRAGACLAAVTPDSDDAAAPNGTALPAFYLYGGRGASNVDLGDVWAFGGGRWSLLDAGGASSSAPPRRFAACGVVSGGDNLVVFGGSSGAAPLADAWTFHVPTRVWLPIAAAGTPPPPTVSAAFAWVPPFAAPGDATAELGDALLLHGGLAGGGDAPPAVSSATRVLSVWPARAGAPAPGTLAGVWSRLAVAPASDAPARSSAAAVWWAAAAALCVHGGVVSDAGTHVAGGAPSPAAVLAADVVCVDVGAHLRWLYESGTAQGGRRRRRARRAEGAAGGSAGGAEEGGEGGGAGGGAGGATAAASAASGASASRLGGRAPAPPRPRAAQVVPFPVTSTPPSATWYALTVASSASSAAAASAPASEPAPGPRAWHAAFLSPGSPPALLVFGGHDGGARALGDSWALPLPALPSEAWAAYRAGAPPPPPDPYATTYLGYAGAVAVVFCAASLLIVFKLRESQQRAALERAAARDRARAAAAGAAAGAGAGAAAGAAASSRLAAAVPPRGLEPALIAHLPTFAFAKPAPSRSAVTAAGAGARQGAATTQGVTVMMDMPPLVGGAAARAAARRAAGAAAASGTATAAAASGPDAAAPGATAGAAALDSPTPAGSVSSSSEDGAGSSGALSAGAAAGVEGGGLGGADDSASLASSPSEEAERCAICLADFGAGDALLLLPCLHSYHELCVAEWLRGSPYCPLCKLDVGRHAANTAYVLGSTARASPR